MSSPSLPPPKTPVAAENPASQPPTPKTPNAAIPQLKISSPPLPPVSVSNTSASLPKDAHDDHHLHPHHDEEHHHIETEMLRKKSMEAQRIVVSPLDVVKNFTLRPTVFSKTVRKDVTQFFKKAITASILICILIIAQAGITIGSVHGTSSYFPLLEVTILNQDSTVEEEGNFGALSNQLMSFITRDTTFTWKTVTNSSANTELHQMILGATEVNHEVQLRNYVDQGNTWAMLVIPKYFSERVRQSMLEGKEYVGNDCRFYFDQGRALGAISIIRSTMTSLINDFNYNVSRHLVSTKNINGQSLNYTDPNVIVKPVVIHEVNIHPVSNSRDGIVTSVAYTLLFICAISAVATSFGATAELFEKIQVWHAFILRYCHMTLVTLIVSFVISILTLIFGAQLSADKFFLLWVWNYIVFSSYCGLIGSIEVLFGPPGAIVTTIVFTINLSAAGGDYPLELSHPVFYIGYGLPIYHSIQGCKTIMFGSRDTIWFNLIILLAYVFVCNMIVVAGTYFKVYQKIRDTLIHKNNNSKMIHDVTHEVGRGTHHMPVVLLS